MEAEALSLAGQISWVLQPLQGAILFAVLVALLAVFFTLGTYRENY